MRKLAFLRLPISDPSKADPPHKYAPLISFSFGATELEVHAYDLQTKEEVQTSVVSVAE